MAKRILTIILALALIGCFFLPYFTVTGDSPSGYDTVFGAMGKLMDWQKYIVLLVPLSGALLLIGAVNNEHYVLGRTLLSWLPLLTLLYLFVGKPLVDGEAIGDIFKTIGQGYGIGLWITIGVSLVLAVSTLIPSRK